MNPQKEQPNPGSFYSMFTSTPASEVSPSSAPGVAAVTNHLASDPSSPTILSPLPAAESDCDDEVGKSPVRKKSRSSSFALDDEELNDPGFWEKLEGAPTNEVPASNVEESHDPNPGPGPLEPPGGTPFDIHHFYFKDGQLCCLSCPPVKENTFPEISDTSPSALVEHIIVFHGAYYLGLAQAETVSQKIEAWKRVQHDNIRKDAFVCTICLNTNKDRSNLRRSCSKRDCSCTSTKLDLYCGANGRLSTLPTSEEAGPPRHKPGTLELVVAPNFTHTTKALQPYRRKGEEIDVYVPFFYPLVDDCIRRNIDFDSMMRELVVHSRIDIDPQSEIQLAFVHTLLTSWMKNEHAEHLINMIDPKIRGYVVTFAGLDVNEVTVGTTFTLYKNLENLLRELKHFVNFLWRIRSPIIHWFVAEQLRLYNYAHNDLLMPLILEAYLKEKRDHRLMTDVELYCLVRSMVLTKKGLRFRDCGELASIISRVVHMMRAGQVTTFSLRKQSMDDDAMKNSAIEAREAHVAHKLAGMTRVTRDMSNRKNESNTAETDNENVFYENNRYWKEDFSTLIPATVEKCREALAFVYEGDNWQSFLDFFTPISISRFKESSLSFSIKIGDTSLMSEDLKLRGGECDLQLRDEMLQQLGMFLDLAFDCYGCGVGRLTEIRAITLSRLKFKLGTIEYWLEVLKMPKLMVKEETRKIKYLHILPMEICHVFLLYRFALQSIDAFKDSKLALPENSSENLNMRHAARELFDTVDTPSVFEIRQVFSTFHNLLFGKAHPGTISCPGDIAELLGHSERTHLARYHTKVRGATIKQIRIYLQALGGVPLCYDNTKLTGEHLLQALSHMLGIEEVHYLSILQGLLVWHIVCGTKNGHGGLQCGGGKSMSWLLPVGAAYFFNKKLGTIIVVSPYKSLNDHHVVAAEKLFANTLIVIEKCGSSDGESISELARKLRGEEAPGVPDIAFITISAFAALYKNETPSLNKNTVHAIIFDEAQTFFSELYRQEYKAIPGIGKLGIPVTTLSGTLSFDLIAPLHEFLQLPRESCSRILDPELLGKTVPGFYFECRQVQDLIKEGINVVIRRVPTADSDQCIHIICNTTFTAHAMNDRLSRRGYDPCLITGDHTDEEKAKAAEMWARSKRLGNWDTEHGTWNMELGM